MSVQALDMTKAFLFLFLVELSGTLAL